MQARITYDFSGKIWRHRETGGWYFVSLPASVSEEIRAQLQWQEEGWGRMKTTARVNGISWETAIWFDKKEGTYLLPLKADIRKKAGLGQGDTIALRIQL